MNTLLQGEPNPMAGAGEWPQKRRLKEAMTQGLVFDTSEGYLGLGLDDAHRLTEIVMPRPTPEEAADALGVLRLQPAPEPHPAGELIDQLRRYFSGEPVTFRWPFNLSHLSPFHQEALNMCASIPYGELRSYGWIADRMDRPKSARPVGGAMAANPIPILIPCHRVVGSNGKLVGYGGGMHWKERLLKLEGVL